MPFSGCARRCIFCDQRLQSGQEERPAAPALEQAARWIDAAAADARGTDRPGRGGRRRRADAGGRAQGRDDEAAVRGPDAETVPRPAPEIAFYGGTFTALADGEFRACLDFVRAQLDLGRISAARCSTRPDKLDGTRLAAMRAAGISLVELGVQSFQDRALESAGRGYSGAAALNACAAVKEAGFALGIQLMPGMPGLDAAGARRDVHLALSSAPDCARLYPCLVPEGTELAQMWRAGRYTPWDEETTTEFLAWALTVFRSAGIPVIRIGVAEEAGSAGRFIAGPRHPALGNRVRALALYNYVREMLGRLAPDAGRPGAPEYRLGVPAALQGEFWGHGGELKERYAALGLTKAHVCLREENDFTLGRVAGRQGASSGGSALNIPELFT
ncbi:MAG: radical SAM protein [Desulfovibrio sp.]|nr:radical SAM protein [Desulfovibrio sp.]